MDIEKNFHMTGGIGHTSYAKNSSLQKKTYDRVKHITTKTIQELCLSIAPKSMGMADLGCSSGPNTLSVIKDIIQAVQLSSRRVLHQPPEITIYLNDLPTNDFNSIFKSLPDFIKQLHNEINDIFPSIFIGGYPGSFYGRLFPNNSLHFVFSSQSLHWLSRVPLAIFDEKGKSMNRGAIYISEASPLVVSQAYYKQFQEDFSLFLRSRSEEVVVGGRMVLILLGREGSDHVDRGNSFFWKLLSMSFAILVSKGEVEMKKVDSYDVHFYAPSKCEIEEEVTREGSFDLDSLEMFEIERDEKGIESYGTKVARAVRAIQESMISQHFGEAILDSLFDVYGRMVDEEMAKEVIKSFTLLAVLRKL